MTAALRLQVVEVSAITSETDAFRCVPYACTMLASACVARRARVRAGVDAVRFAPCKGCTLGAEVERRSGLKLNLKIHQQKFGVPRVVGTAARFNGFAGSHKRGQLPAGGSSERVLSALGTGSLTRSQIIELCGLAGGVVDTALRRLRKSGRIEQGGERGSRVYRVRNVAVRKVVVGG